MVVFRTPMTEDVLARNHLAQLCRGFLMLQPNDLNRAQQFLATFLVESSKNSA
jgi:hypothetical protein